MLDTSANAFVTGVTDSTDFPTTPGAFQGAICDRWDPGGVAFVTEFNAAGSALTYSKYFGGEFSQGASIALDASNDIYFTGCRAAGDFPVTPGALAMVPGL